MTPAQRRLHTILIVLVVLGAIVVVLTTDSAFVRVVFIVSALSRSGMELDGVAIRCDVDPKCAITEQRPAVEQLPTICEWPLFLLAFNGGEIGMLGADLVRHLIFSVLVGHTAATSERHGEQRNSPTRLHRPSVSVISSPPAQ